MPRVAVVGGGLLGRLAAWRLAARGLSVSLLERGGTDAAGAAGRTAAGMLAPWSERPASGSEVFDVGLRSLGEWPGLLNALREDSGMTVPMCRNGTLLVAHQADASLLTRLRQTLHRYFPDDPGICLVSPRLLERLEPALAGRFESALWIRREAGIANEVLFDALLSALRRRGVTLRFHTEVSDLGPGWLRADGRETFDWIVDCRGAGAKPHLPDLRGVRGEVIRVRAPDVAISRPVRLMHPRYPLYVAPRPGHRYVVGATEIESESREGVTVRSALELLSALFSLHPGFAEAEIESMQANLRPAFSDHRPRMEVANGLVRLNGLYRHGYLVAPAMTGWLADLLQNGTPPAHPFVMLAENNRDHPRQFQAC